ncbi:hypothetical protein L6164_032585 [Bauhinia variegata]|uniref:Uncharacterized protein n=1 Tax=Bauhinia variegata TaxID=167791 RepID=A0ACB9KP15_BAUVA|nr:hypothetical protein L6164_032585 [Bauhinia variegata]
MKQLLLRSVVRALISGGGDCEAIGKCWGVQTPVRWRDSEIPQSSIRFLFQGAIWLPCNDGGNSGSSSRNGAALRKFQHSGGWMKAEKERMHLMTMAELVKPAPRGTKGYSFWRCKEFSSIPSLCFTFSPLPKNGLAHRLFIRWVFGRRGCGVVRAAFEIWKVENVPAPGN